MKSFAHIFKTHSLHVQRTVAVVEQGAILKNLSFLNSVGKKEHDVWHGMVPMVKCNAYGHGLVPTAQLLKSRREVMAFGVTSVHEAIELRKAGLSTDLWIFSDCAPLNEDIFSICEKFRLTPIIHHLDDFKKLVTIFKNSKLVQAGRFHIKFNTGMNRLGIDWRAASLIATILKSHQIAPMGICTHFASSEKPSNRLTQLQAKRFKEIHKMFSQVGSVFFHAANTGAILNARQLGLREICNLARPGIGLYGYSNTQAGEQWSNKNTQRHGGLAQALTPALRWYVRSLGVHHLQKGDSVGYGSMYTAKANMFADVLGVGYGDGLKRMLSNQKIFLEVEKNKFSTTQVLGRVSMDTMVIKTAHAPGITARASQALALSFNTRVDRRKKNQNTQTWYCIMGASASQAHHLAQASGTVVYEVLTSISPRVPRLYV